MSAELVRRLMYQSPAEWRADVLHTLTQAELTSLCHILGIAHSGTKPEQIARLLSLGRLRVTLSAFGGGSDESYEAQQAAADVLAAAYTRVELKAMSRQAGLFTSTTKRGLAAGLLSWRNNCRQRGQEALRAARAAAALLPQQQRLPLVFPVNQQKEQAA